MEKQCISNWRNKFYLEFFYKCESRVKSWFLWDPLQFPHWLNRANISSFDFCVKKAQKSSSFQKVKSDLKKIYNSASHLDDLMVILSWNFFQLISYFSKRNLKIPSLCFSNRKKRHDSCIVTIQTRMNSGWNIFLL